MTSDGLEKGIRVWAYVGSIDVDSLNSISFFTLDDGSSVVRVGLQMMDVCRSGGAVALDGDSKNCVGLGPGPLESNGMATNA